MRNLLFIILLISTLSLVAQTKNPSDNKPVVVKVETPDPDVPAPNQGVTVDGVTYIPRPDGILITLPRASNNVKLLALTGEVVWSGALVQGRFFIPTRPGIYFLRINNKSYKVICK